MSKKRKFTIGKLFDNNKFVLILSLFLAFFIWVGFSMYGGEEQEKTIEVPIKMDSMTVPAQFNLQQFGDYSNSTVLVKIVGKKAVIGTVNSDDIKVIASTLDVNTPGKHSLPLSVTIDSTKDFQIVSTNTLSVEVYFDIYKEVTMAVSLDMQEEPGVPEGYQLGTITFSDDKLLAHGPSTEVSKISKILAKAEIDEVLTKTTTYKAQIVAVDKYDNEIQNITIDNADDFTVTIPVYKLAKLPVSIDLTNMPSGITKDDINITYSVSSLNVAGEASTIDNMKSVVIGTVDFSELTDVQTTFDFDVSSIAGIKIKSKVSSIKVTIDLSGYESKKITLPASSIEIVNSTNKKITVLTESVEIKAAGLTKSVKSITASDISAVLNIDDDVKSGDNQKLPLTLKTNVQGVWVVGTYEVEANVK